MLLSLPDECKQLLWRWLDARTLCRVACTARGVDHGVVLAPLWKRLALDMVRREIQRIETTTLPPETGLQRQNATRRLDLSGLSTGNRYNQLLLDAPHNDEANQEHTAVEASFWKHWYRDFDVAARSFDVTHAAFNEGKSELQELKRQRSELRELLEATKSKSHGDKKLRRLQMNCVRWLNRTTRRAAASDQARSAQHVALTKSELADALQSVETTLQCQSKALFSLRSQYQKSLHLLTGQVARGKRVLADLDE